MPELTDTELLTLAINVLEGTQMAVSPQSTIDRLEQLGWVHCPFCGNWTSDDELRLSGENDGCNWCL